MTSAPYIVTIDRDGLDTGSANKPVLIEDVAAGVTTACAEAVIDGARIVYGPARQNGARVWIEAHRVQIIR